MEAIRTIIGTVRGTSHSKLYDESGFCSLKERRRRHKLLMYHKLVNGKCPIHLANILSPLVSSVNPYHRRHPFERVGYNSRTSLYQNSFFPSTTMLWNALPEDIQSTTEISSFKRFLTMSDIPVPRYYFYGNRAEQIIHCRLRLGMNDLNSDLFDRHLRDTAECSCGDYTETAEHFLLYCPNYDEIRSSTIFELDPNYIDATVLLKRDNLFSYETNVEIFAKVHEFVSVSKRF